MDTDKLNRELQVFRNHVKIARENVIHKLVRDIKFWKAKHETNSDNKRAAKKVDSLEALIVHIKSLTASDLTKAVIRFNPKKSSGCGGLEERALVRFHENKKLQPELKALIRRFGLTSKLDVLDKYLKNRGDGKKAQTGKKMGNKKGKPKKTQKEVKGEQESEDQGFCEADDAQETKERASESMVCDDDSEEAEQEAGKFVKVAPVKVKDVKKKAGSRKEGKNKKEVKPPEEDDSENECIQVQDSFFVTSSGQTYVATAPVVDKKQLEQEEKDEFSWKRSNKRKDVIVKKEERLPVRLFLGSKEAAIDNNSDIHPSWKAKQQQKGIKQFQGQRKRFDEEKSVSDKLNSTQEDPDLHPSWAAKQKQRNLQPFAGKKIRFDAVEEAENAVEENLHPSWAAKQKQRGFQPFAGKKIVFDSSEQTETEQESKDALHPSWVAKQKQKGLKPFQGKKIVFEADAERTVETPVATDLHPSWAAKQKEKGIQEFRGKKITFDD